MAREFRYYVIVSDVEPRDNPYALVRVWGPDRGIPNEEFFSPRLVWERNSILNQIGHGSMDREPEQITEREVEHYVEVLTRRFKAQQES